MCVCVCVCFTGPVGVLYMKNASPLPYALAHFLTSRRVSHRTNMFNFLSALGVFIFFFSVKAQCARRTLSAVFICDFPQGLFLFSVSSFNHMDSLAWGLEFKTLLLLFLHHILLLLHLLLFLSFLFFEREPHEVFATG